MAIGLQRGMVQIVPYDAVWRQVFERERVTLAHVFGDSTVVIEHVGSTAVPGLSAKPIIDIEVGLHNFNDWRSFVPALQAVGYAYMADRVTANEVFMPRGPEANRTHYLHITAFGSDEWASTLHFRDTLRTDAGLRQEYHQLKERLAHEFANDRKAYSDGKAAFIQKITQA